MKKIRVQDAVGMELCHDITEMNDGFKGAAFRRGHIILESDIEHMLRIGKQHIFVWEENAGDVHEDDCARRMAAMAPVDGAHYTEPAEGKVLPLSFPLPFLMFCCLRFLPETGSPQMSWLDWQTVACVKCAKPVIGQTARSADIDYIKKDPNVEEDIRVLCMKCKVYSAVSLGSRMFSRIATMAAGTMPEPPKISLTASGAKFRMAVLAPMP